MNRARVYVPTLGEIVKLNSGGPALMVESVRSNVVWVSWRSSENDRQTRRFLIEQLSPYCDRNNCRVL